METMCLVLTVPSCSMITFSVSLFDAEDSGAGDPKLISEFCSCKFSSTPPVPGLADGIGAYNLHLSTPLTHFTDKFQPRYTLALIAYNFNTLSLSCSIPTIYYVSYPCSLVFRFLNQWGYPISKHPSIDKT